MNVQVAVRYDNRALGTKVAWAEIRPRRTQEYLRCPPVDTTNHLTYENKNKNTVYLLKIGPTYRSGIQ